MKKLSLKLSIKQIAIFSVMVYIVLAAVFEESKVGLARYASVGLMLCLLCCTLYIGVKKRLKYSWLVIALVVFGGVLSVSAVYSPTQNAIVNMYLYRYWTSVILVLLFVNVVTNEQDIKKILHAYILAGLFMALYLYSYYGFSSLMASAERLDGKLGNQNSIGITCATAIILSIIFMVDAIGLVKYLYMIPIVVCTPACLFTGSRKSIILIALCLVLYFFASVKETGFFKRLFWLLLIVLGIYILINNVSAFSVIKERFHSLFSLLSDSESQLDAGSENRIKYITEGWAAFIENPIWGFGFAYSYNKWGVYSHNNYIELLMNNGLLGFLLYYFCHFKIIGRLFSQGKWYKDNITRIGAVLITILLFLDIGSVNYYVRYTLIMIALASVISRRESEEKQS